MIGDAHILERSLYYIFSKLSEEELKVLKEDLQLKIDNKFSELNEEQVKRLVVEKKWIPAISAGIDNELTSLSQALTRRILELYDRYSTPLASIAKEVGALSTRVGENLKKMGFEWS